MDYNKILHNYIIRVVIFSAFLFKEKRKDENIYLFHMNKFLKKRINLDLNLSISVGPKMNRIDHRETLIDSLLNDKEWGYMNLVILNFTTPLQRVDMQINLMEEEKYMNYIYS